MAYKEGPRPAETRSGIRCRAAGAHRPTRSRPSPAWPSSRRRGSCPCRPRSRAGRCGVATRDRWAEGLRNAAGGEAVLLQPRDPCLDVGQTDLAEPASRRRPGARPPAGSPDTYGGGLIEVGQPGRPAAGDLGEANLAGARVDVLPAAHGCQLLVEPLLGVDASGEALLRCRPPRSRQRVSQRPSRGFLMTPRPAPPRPRRDASAPRHPDLVGRGWDAPMAIDELDADPVGPRRLPPGPAHPAPRPLGVDQRQGGPSLRRQIATPPWPSPPNCSRLASRARSAPSATPSTRPCASPRLRCSRPRPSTTADPPGPKVAAGSTGTTPDAPLIHRLPATDRVRAAAPAG